MTRTLPLSDLATSDLLHRYSSIRDQLIQAGLFPPLPGRLRRNLAGTPPDDLANGPKPLPLSKDQLVFFHQLGPQLLSFYRALNHLYLDSVRGPQPSWVAGYLDQGKPEGLVTYSRMKRFRDHLPASHPTGHHPDTGRHGHHRTRHCPRRHRHDRLPVALYAQHLFQTDPSPTRRRPRRHGSGICGHVASPARPAYGMRRDSGV